MNQTKCCPFCGEPPTLWVDNHYDDKFVVECSECGVSKRSEYSHESAIDDWNTRYMVNSDGERVRVPDVVSLTKFRAAIYSEDSLNDKSTLVWESERLYDTSLEASAAAREHVIAHEYIAVANRVVF